MSYIPIYDNAWLLELIPEFLEDLRNNGVSGPRCLEQMCPKGFWETLPNGVRRSAGRSFRNRAKRPGFPIVFDHKTSSKLTFYRLRNSPAQGDAVDID